MGETEQNSNLQEKSEGFSLPELETEAEQKKREAIAELQLARYGRVAFKHRQSERAIYEAMIASNGVAKEVCSKLACTVAEFYRWLSSRPKAFKFWQEQRKELVASAECVLLRHLNSQNEQVAQNAAKFILERLARDEWGSSPQIAQQIVANGDVSIKEIFGLDK